MKYKSFHTFLIFQGLKTSSQIKFWNYLIIIGGILFLISPSHLFAQCSNATIFGSFQPTSVWQTINFGRPGEGQVFKADSGCVYQFSYCVSDGGSASGIDTEITIRDNNNSFIPPNSYNDNGLGCGTASKLTWTAPYTGEFRISTHRKPCLTSTTTVTLAFRRLSCPPPICSTAFTDQCIYDAPGGLDNCYFLGDLCADGFAYAGGLQTSSAFQIPQLQKLDSILFFLYTSGCPPGATQGFSFYLNGNLIGTASPGANDCVCAAQDYPRTVALSPPTLQSFWNRCGNNVLGVSANNDPNYAVSGYSARLYYDNRPAPSVITTNSTLCSPVILTPSTPPCNVVEFWQGLQCDSSRAFPALNSYLTTVVDTYFLRAKSTILDGCWSTTCSQFIVPTLVTHNTISTSQTLCRPTVPSLLTGPLASGGTGVYQYQWESSPDNLTWQAISGMTQPSYQPALPLSITYFRRKVTSGCIDLSNVVQIVAEDSIGANNISNIQTLCQSQALPVMTVSSPSGGNGNYQYQWLSGSNPNILFPISGATSSNLSPALLANTSYFSRMVSGGVCPAHTSTVIEVQVEFPPSPNIIGSSQILCSTSSPTLLTGTLPTGGIGVYQYQWLSASNPTGTWTSLAGETQQNYLPGSISSTAYFRRNLSSGICPIDSSLSLVLEIHYPILSGVIGSSQTICQGITPAVLNSTAPSGGNGFFSFQWESSSNQLSWFVLSGETQAQLAPDPTQGIRYYRRTITSGVCPPAVNPILTVEIVPAIVGNILQPSQTLCSSASPGVLTGGNPSGGTGTYSYSWASSSNGGFWQLIVGATSPQWLAPALYGNSYFKRIVNSVVCRDSSPVLTFQVSSVISQNQIFADQTICESFAPLAFTGPVPLGTGGVPNYSWEDSPDALNWSNIPGATQSSYIGPALTVSRYFRRILNSTVCNPLTTTPVLVRVEPTLSNPSIFSDQTLCAGANPAILSGFIPTGGNGQYSYQWQSSGNGNLWIDRVGDVYSQLQPPALSFSSYYRRIIQAGVCPASSSNAVALSVFASPGNNLIGNQQTICSGTVPIPLTGSTPTGGDGNYVYQWQASTSGTTWSSIGNGLTLSLPGLLQTFYYRRVVDSGPCAGDTSAIITISVEEPIGNNQLGSNQTICETASPPVLTGSSPTGGNGQYNYTWESSSNSINWVIISLVNNSFYQPSVVLGTIYYRRIVSSGLCVAQTSIPQMIQVDATIRGNQIGSNQTLCSGNVPQPLQGTTPSGGNGAYVYLWLESLDQINWSTASGNNSLSNYTPPALIVSKWYKRIVISGGCANDTSLAVSIQIVPRIGNNLIGNQQTICQGQLFQPLTGSLPTGGTGVYTYQWQSSVNQLFWASTGILTKDGGTPIISNGTVGFRRIVFNSVCSSDTSSIVSLHQQALIAGNLISTNQTICRGEVPDTLRGSGLSGGDGNYVYQWESSNMSIGIWSNAATQQNQPLSAITDTLLYRRIVTSGLCPSNTSNSVLLLSQPPISGNTITSNQTICAGSPAATVTGSIPSGGDGNYIYYWESSQLAGIWTYAGNQSSVIPWVMSSDRYFRRIVTSGFCPLDTSLGIGIRVQQPLSGSSIGAVQTLCSGQTPTLFTGNIPSGGNGTLNYQWQSSSNSFSWSSLSGASAQDYQSISLTRTTYFRRTISSGVCFPFNDLPIEVIVNPVATLRGLGDTVCVGLPAYVAAVPSIPGGAYLWAPTGQTTQQIGNTPTQTTDYFLTYTLNGCVSPVLKVTAKVNPLPPAVITYPDSSILCLGQTKSLTANQGSTAYIYNWASGATTATFLATGPGYYSVTVTSADGCKKSAAVQLTYPPQLLSVECPPIPGACPDTLVQINALVKGGYAPYTYKWTPVLGLSSSTIASPSFWMKGPVNYRVVVTDSMGCKDTAAILVQPYPGVTAGFQIEGLKGDTLTYPNPIKIYPDFPYSGSCFWDFSHGLTHSDCQPESWIPEEEDRWRIKLQLISKEGCQDSFVRTFYYKFPILFKVSNAFTPNGDGYNDFFYLSYLNVAALEINIFDRWGNLVYNSQDPNFRWDGMVGNRALPEGVYVYALQLWGIRGELRSEEGTITLIR